MAEITELDADSQVASIDTEHTLYDSNAAAGVFQFWVDISVLQAGDEVVLRQKSPAAAGGTQRTFEERRYDYNMSLVEPVVVFDLVSSSDYLCSLEQTDGTGRTFPWGVRGYLNA